MDETYKSRNQSIITDIVKDKEMSKSEVLNCNEFLDSNVSNQFAMNKHRRVSTL